MSSNPQLRQSFGYEPRISDAPQIKQGEIDHYSKVRHRQRRKSKSFKSESEEYDTLGSDSDTEQGTSSRTESSNHLDDPGSGPGPGLGPGTSRAGAGIHKPVHHNFLYHAHESSTSTEPSPISERKSFPRHGKFRNNIGNGRMLRKLPTAETAFVLGQKLEPPSGFSDGHELSEAECDIDSVKKLRIGIMKNSLNIFGPSSGNQDFTIAV
ncbi:hypothetical protein R5R35_002069 [Gryllus longicercus]|uniref:Uncharacterized protein n=1 Tax=Gryllus longicercus TaxID=2509291 RepID=A0AAN9VD63_9ORTH